MNNTNEKRAPYRPNQIVYTQIHMPADAFLSQTQKPHTQPGKELLFGPFVDTTGKTDIFSTPPRVIVGFGVPIKKSLTKLSLQEVRDHFNDPNLRLPFGSFFRGILNPQHIVQCLVSLPRDVLHPARGLGHISSSEECMEHVQEGDLPNYLVARDMVARRCMAIIALQQVLKNSDPEMARIIQEEMTKSISGQGSWAYRGPEQEYRKVYDCIHALRYFLPSNVVCSQNFAHEISFQGIAYANPIGMDLPMRTVQKCIQAVLPHLDATSITSLNALQEAFRRQYKMDASRGICVSQKVIQECMYAACEEWKQAAPPNLKPHIEQIQQNLPAMIQQGRKEMMTPEAFRMRQIMSRTRPVGPADDPYLPSMKSEAGVLRLYQYELKHAGYGAPGATMEQLIATALEGTYTQARDAIRFHDMRSDYIAMATTAYVDTLCHNFAAHFAENVITRRTIYKPIENVLDMKARELSIPDDVVPRDAMARIMEAAADQIAILTDVARDQLPSLHEIEERMYVPNEDMYLGYICRDTPVALAHELQERFDARFMVNQLDDVLAKRNPDLDSTLALRAYTVWQITKEMQREYAPGSPERIALIKVRENSITNLHSRVHEHADYHAILRDAFEQDGHDSEEIGEDPR